MKRHLLLIPMILASSAALADAQAQAAALLTGSRPSPSQTKLTYSGVHTIGAAR